MGNDLADATGNISHALSSLEDIHQSSLEEVPDCLSPLLHSISFLQGAGSIILGF